MKNRLFRFIAQLLIISIASLGLPFSPAQAGIVGTDQIVSSEQSQQDRARVLAFLDRTDVQTQLQSQGIDADTAKARVDSLTDEEVQKLAGKIDSLPAGGDALGVILFIFVVLLITDILGFTKVFPFTRSMK